MVDRAIAAAKSELVSIDFRFDETVVPVGFEFYDGEHGSKQTISVPMDSSDEYLMRNDEWSLQVNIRKTDSIGRCHIPQLQLIRPTLSNRPQR